jgi:hypothetical protein
MFTNFIGIDYSGRGTPLHRLPGLQVYAATGHRLPERVNGPSGFHRVCLFSGMCGESGLAAARVVPHGA